MPGPISLLLVGGDSDTAADLQTSLRSHPGRRFTVETCGTLSAALECLQDRHFDLVLLHLDLPDAGGITTYARLRAAHPYLAVVVLAVLFVLPFLVFLLLG